MDSRGVRKNYMSSSMRTKIYSLMTLFVCVICTGCNIPKVKISLVKENSGMSFAAEEVKIYDNFEQINGNYEILGNISAGILPVGSSTSAKRTKVLIEKAGQNGANGVVGLYDKEYNWDEFLWSNCPPRTTGILVHVADKDEETTVERPAFIVKVLPVIWAEEALKYTKHELLGEIMMAKMHLAMRKKGYYAKPIEEVDQKYNISDLEVMDKERLVSLFGKETDYVFVMEVVSRKYIFLALLGSAKTRMKVSLFSIRNQTVAWSNDVSVEHFVGVVVGLMYDIWKEQAVEVVKGALKKMPASGL
jgi:hypothetical protein